MTEPESIAPPVPIEVPEAPPRPRPGARRSPFPIEVFWPGWLGWPRRATLQQRLIWLTALAVATAVALTGIALYFATRHSLYEQLDNELLQTANLLSDQVASENDLSTVGGINPDSLQAANVVLALVQANLGVTIIPGETITYDTGAPEVTIARTGRGHSARSVVASDGELYRIVAVPLSGRDGYALVLGRSLRPGHATPDVGNLGRSRDYRRRGRSLLRYGRGSFLVAADPAADRSGNPDHRNRRIGSDYSRRPGRTG